MATSSPNLFGAVEDKERGKPSCASRLIVRDADMQNAADFEEDTDMPYTEIKFENTINRQSGTAEHPRQIERVPAGAIFNVEMILNIFVETTKKSVDGKTDIDLTEPEMKKQEADKLKEYKDLLQKGFNILNHDYLGGHGSRGYGHVHIGLVEPKPVDYSKSVEI